MKIPFIDSCLFFLLGFIRLILPWGTTYTSCEDGRNSQGGISIFSGWTKDSDSGINDLLICGAKGLSPNCTDYCRI